MLPALALKSTLVLAVAFLAAAALRKSSAAIRHLVWTCACAGLLLLPLLQQTAPRWRVPVSAAVTLTPAVESPSAPAPPPARHWNYDAIWYAGIGVAALRLLIAFTRLYRLRHSAVPARWSRSPNPSILESAEIDFPITIGVIRPAIVFPTGAGEWPSERLRLVLAHELAHVKRLDCLTQLLVESACAVYWFHPLAWLAAAQFRKERERACDDSVLSQGVKSSDYAEHVLAVVKSVRAKGAPAMALSINSHDLQERLKAVLKPQADRRAATPGIAFAAFLLATIVVVPVATMRAQAPNPSTGLTGSVYDASGGAVPQATVTAIGLDTHNKEVIRSGDAGSYAFHSLPPGRYLIEVRAPGFSIFQKQLIVTAGETVRFDASLALGGVVENVDVVGRKPASAAAYGQNRVPQRVRIGGNVQPVKLVYKTNPIYPEHAKQNGMEGSVVLQGVISTSGSVIGLEALSKSVDPELIQAAMDAVSQWRFEPTLLNGVPVEVVTSITINFRLD